MPCTRFLVVFAISTIFLTSLVLVAALGAGRDLDSDHVKKQAYCMVVVGFICALFIEIVYSFKKTVYPALHNGSPVPLVVFQRPPI